MTKRRVKISRPADAAPNTAFTQVSRRSEHNNKHAKIRVALDPSDLADDQYGADTDTCVCGPVVYQVVGIDDAGRVYADGWQLLPSCRSPSVLRDKYYRSIGVGGLAGADFLGTATR